jgi:hypothetical protein
MHEIGCNQLIEGPTAAGVESRSRRADPFAICIERPQQARFALAGTRLKTPQRVRSYEERRFNRAVTAPERTAFLADRSCGSDLEK